jgi:hypothetical protein
MVCPCCVPFSPSSCADCCSEWTLPGNAGDVPDEIQVELTIGPFEQCYQLGFATTAGGLRYATILDTVFYSGTITLVRIGAAGVCGTWAYDNCDGTERVQCEVRLGVQDSECVWLIRFTYNICKPAPECAAVVSPATIQTLCCDSTPGFVVGFSSEGLLLSKAMSSECDGAEDESSGVSIGGPFGPGGSWVSRCNTANTLCLENVCGSTTSPFDCPDNITVPISYKIIP